MWGKEVGSVRNGGRKKKNEREKSTDGLGWRRVEEEVFEARQSVGSIDGWAGEVGKEGNLRKRD